MPHDIYQSVLEAKTHDEFRREIVRFACHLEFETVSALTVLDREDGTTEFIAFNNAPAAFQPFDVPESGRRDPVMQHCKNSRYPIVWDQSTYVQSGHADLWEQLAPLGFCTGIGLALHLPHGRHFVLTLDRDQSLPKDPDELVRMTSSVQLFALYAQEAAAQILLPPPREVDQPKLTPEELEVLRWTMEGDTPWDIGQVLNLTERSVVFHISNAGRKLQCKTKHQAAIKALRLGLIG